MCDVIREKIILDIFKEKQTIITLATPDIGSHLDFNCMSTLPLMHFTDIENIPTKHEDVKESIMMDFDMTRGFIFHGSAENLIQNVFKKVGKHNPKTRFLIFLTGVVTEDTMHEIFVKGWNQNRIHDIFIIIDEEFKLFFQPFSVYSYNLFDNAKTSSQLIKIEFPFMFGDGLDQLETFKLKRFSNLNGYPLKVVLFQFLMVCKGEMDPSGNFILETLKFQDPEALKILSKYMNFSIQFVKSTDGINHGYETSNKTFTGSLGMIEYEHADFAANARLVAEYNTTNSLCLFPTTTTKLKFAVPKKYWDEVNILVSIYNFLDINLKICIFTIFIVLPTLILITDKIQGIEKYSIFESLTSNYLMFYAILTFVSIKLPKNWTTRCLVGSVIIIWLVIGNMYSSKMIEFLNTNSGLKQIGSIEELMESDLSVKVPYPMAILFEGNFKNTSKSHQFINHVVTKSRELERIGNKWAFIDIENMGDLIRSKKFALLFLDNLIDHVEKGYYDKNGNNILTHIEETPYEYYYSTSVPKTSPFVQHFNDILMRIFEAGISKYQMNIALIDNDLVYIRRMKEGKVPNNGLKSISLQQLYSVFYVYLISLGTCLCIFIAEIVLHKSLKLCFFLTADT
ncbi:uncharacterized protein [Chironomus tepperi]